MKKPAPAAFTVRHHEGETVTTEELTAKLLAGINEVRAGLLGESNWYERVETLGRNGALDDLYAMGASLGWLRADIRWTIWGGSVEALA